VSGGEWRLVAASAAGTSHARRGVACQDANLCRVLGDERAGAVLVAILADGAGSASRAEAGAGLACSHILGEVEALLARGGCLRDVDRGCVEGWLAGLQLAAADRAAAEGLTARDFASTLLAALVGEACAVFFQVGDGAIVVAGAPPAEGYDCVFWPGHDEYENVTFFAVEANAAQHLEHAIVERRVRELALFSDGLQRLALDYANRKAHAPFFRAMLSPLRTAAGLDCSALAGRLAAFLDSPRVNDRTDDDKTLILAARGSDAVED
jgi:hypothetical protein